MFRSDYRRLRRFYGMLRTTGAYATPPDAALPISRIPGFPPLLYYGGTIWRILQDSHSAARGRYSDRVWAHGSFSILRAAESAGARVCAAGLAHIREAARPVVFIANHMSMLETLLLPVLILPFQPVTFVVKQSLLQYPLFGDIMRAVRPIAVNRINPREDFRAVMTGGCRRLAAGRSMIVFPQSTRSREFCPEKFNTLGVKLARRAGAPVIPVALKTDFQGQGRWIRDAGPVHPERRVYFHFGSPLDADLSAPELHRRVIAFISTHLDRWRAAETPRRDDTGR